MIDNIVGFHIEPTNICTLKCPGCARTRFINQWPQHWKNHTLDVNELFRFLDINLFKKRFLLCGNYGDPIYHPDCIGFVKKIKERGASVTIVTNGSYKSPEWWQELTELLDSTDIIKFSIDGLPENFTQYRINADWPSIEQGIKICVQSSCQTIWKYIPFLYNQSDIKQAEMLSEQLGITHFVVDRSDRFDEQTMHYKPNSELVGMRFNQQQDWKNGNLHRVDPKCYLHNQHFISADGFYSPCCFLADHRFYYKTMFGKSKKMFNIKHTTIQEILNCSQVVDFYNNLEIHQGCQYNCSGD